MKKKLNILKTGKTHSAFLLFIIWPFATFLYYLTKLNHKWAKNVIWLFVGFFGLTMISASETADMIRIRESLVVFHNMDLTFNNVLSMIYSESTNYVDFFQPLILFLVSRVTNNGSILYMIFGLIYGYFWSRNVCYAFKLVKNKSRAITLLISVIVLILPYWYINGIRFYLAIQIFLYGLFPMVVENRRKSIIWVLLTPFVHFSFILPVVLVLVFWFRLIPIKLNLLFILFLGTYFFGELQLPQVQKTMLRVSPDVFHDRITQYTDVDIYARKSQVSSQKTWHSRLYGPALKYALFLTLSLIFIQRKKIIAQDPQMKIFLGFVLVYMIFANLAANISSGGRFMGPGMFLITVFLLMAGNNLKIKPLLNKTVMTLSPLFLFYLIVQIRTGFDYHSILTVLGNPIAALFIEPGTPLIDLIK